MSDNDLIRRGDALAIVVRDRVPTNRTGSEFRVVSTQDMLKAIAALPAVTVGVRPLVWEPLTLKGLHAFCPLFGVVHYADDADDAAKQDAARAARILAALDLTPAPRRYMGQIMAECDCPREDECQAAGRCIAEVLLRHRPDANILMQQARRQSVAVPVMRLIGTLHPEVSKDDG